MIVVQFVSYNFSLHKCCTIFDDVVHQELEEEGGDADDGEHEEVGDQESAASVHDESINVATSIEEESLIEEGQEEEDEGDDADKEAEKTDIGNIIKVNKIHKDTKADVEVQIETQTVSKWASIR